MFMKYYNVCEIFKFVNDNVSPFINIYYSIGGDSRDIWVRESRAVGKQLEYLLFEPTLMVTNVWCFVNDKKTTFHKILPKHSIKGAKIMLSLSTKISKISQFIYIPCDIENETFMKHENILYMFGK